MYLQLQYSILTKPLNWLSAKIFKFQKNNRSLVGVESISKKNQNLWAKAAQARNPGELLSK